MAFEKIIAIFIVIAILIGGNLAQIYLNFKWASNLNKSTDKKYRRK